jgi:hypothetical protein
LARTGLDIDLSYYFKSVKGGKMAVKLKGNLIGAWAFLIGVLLAIIAGIVIGFSTDPAIYYKVVPGILIVLGIIVGLLNITTKESSSFLLAALALVIVSVMGYGLIYDAIPRLAEILKFILIMFVPTTIIVALKSVFEAAKN